MPNNRLTTQRAQLCNSAMHAAINGEPFDADLAALAAGLAHTIYTCEPCDHATPAEPICSACYHVALHDYLLSDTPDKPPYSSADADTFANAALADANDTDAFGD